MNKKAKIITFEGLDCSFKGTNSRRLYEFIKKNITEKVILISFPIYNSNTGEMIKQYLSGDMFVENAFVSAYKPALLYAVDRFNEMNRLKDIIEDEDYYIIIDRYVGSNMIYQSLSKDEYLSYKKIKFIEYNCLELPKEDIVLYMDMPYKKSYDLSKKRGDKNGITNDIHESNIKYLKKVYYNAADIAKDEKWRIIQCTDHKEIRDSNEIFDEILTVLKYNNLI